MGQTSLKNGVPIVVSLALVFAWSAAEREYFLHPSNRTWEEARNHCQACFKDLVTLTPENVQTVSKLLTSDCWVGLRKNSTSNFNSYSISNATNNSTNNTIMDPRMPWFRWANGDPLIFQNWYPGWPVFRSSLPNRYYFVCPEKASLETAAPETVTPETVAPGTGTPDSGTPATAIQATGNVTGHLQETTFATATAASTPSTPSTPARCKITRWPDEAHYVLLPDFPKPDKNYIEDSCVAMLSFGPWVERVCSELLSSICYEDRFFGELNVTRKTSNSSILTWRSGPGNITHYRVEVTEGDNMLKRNFTTEDLTFDLNSLTPGTRYSIQVFAVKCTRDLNPQEDTFYTTPNKVEDLKFTNVSETSVFLNWTKPAGNLDFYLIKIKNGKQISSKTEGKEVRDLIPGNFYTFTVLSGVGDNSTRSEESIVSRNTKPGRVSDLRVSRNTHHSLQLNWKSPVGNVSFFRVVATINNKPPVPQNVTITEVNVTGLPIGSKITLSVTALVNGNIEGDSVTIDDYTAPGPIQDMNLSSTDVSLNASWKTEGDSSSFVVELLLEGKVDQKLKTHFSEITFTGLKTAAEYNVTVYAFNGHLNGEPLTRSIFTMPSPPTKAKSTYQDKSSITFEWDPPAKVGRVTYAVGIISSFWGHNVSERIENKTTHTFTGLKSGTKYDFRVQTVADKELSTAATVSHCTDADKREISLSMMCSSAEPLLCDGKATRDSVFKQLLKHFNEVLGGNIFWTLEELEPK
ncbi:hypothetical protein JOQ06_019948 [Pogonophryne albipinna]|uniref:Uncharacterized protein n=1 Tax=Pogonophryne albipinna TaxID=1090488 RepID=A0AAD6BQ46_9TELE|nr:hypothetical protein JOQ06_019948 [Pogonophryne albipinna]